MPLSCRQLRNNSFSVEYPSSRQISPNLPKSLKSGQECCCLSITDNLSPWSVSHPQGTHALYDLCPKEVKFKLCKSAACDHKDLELIPAIVANIYVYIYFFVDILDFKLSIQTVGEKNSL